jgi:hypothetical protein
VAGWQGKNGCDGGGLIALGRALAERVAGAGVLRACEVILLFSGGAYRLVMLSLCRTSNKKGVTIPSQISFTEYFGRMLTDYASLQTEKGLLYGSKRREYQAVF